MRRHATTLVLFLVAVVLGLWLWLDRDEVTEGERQRRENNALPAWRREEVSRVEIVRDGDTLVLVRDARAGGPWRMTSPRAERADEAAVERLMTTLELATMVRKVSAGDDTDLGFDAPRAVGSVTMGALVFRFVLGGESPRPAGSGYLRVDDRAPFVASKELTDALLARSDTYRDRTVVPYLPADLARLEVSHPAGGFVVERADERSFKVKGPGVLASRASIDKVWGALAEVRAEAFLEDADVDRLTARPQLSVVMTPKDAAAPPGELVVGEACPGHPSDVVVLRARPTRVAACAPKGAIDALVAVGPEALIDGKPFSFRHDEIEELRLEALGGDADVDGGGAPRVLELARRGTGFYQREPVPRELSPEEADAASELLARIDDSAADAVVAGGGPFTAIARARVRSGDHDEVVEIGPPAEAARDEAHVTLRRVRDDARLTVSRAIARRLVPRATSTRPRALLAETRRVRRVVLRCGAPQELVDDGSGLSLVEPAGYETDGSIVQLVDGLTRGKVLAWVADSDDGSFGVGARDSEDACRVVLAFTDESAPATVRFGAEGEGGVYGMIDGHPEVFVASRALVELARRIYISHGALRAEPASVESVKVASRGKAIEHRDPAASRAAAGGLFADRVIALGTNDVGAVDVTIAITVADGGPTKRVMCSAPTVTPTGRWRRCATPSVKAIFEVRQGVVDAFFEDPPDASRPPVDAGEPSPNGQRL